VLLPPSVGKEIVHDGALFVGVGVGVGVFVGQ